MCNPSAGINSVKPYHVVTVVDGAGTAEVYPTDCVNYFLYGRAMRLCYDLRNQLFLSSSSGISLRRRPMYWRRATVFNNQDRAGISTAVAFAEAGWTGNWNAINDMGLPGAVPNSAKYQCYLEWKVGAYPSTANGDWLVGIIDFQQSAIWSDFQDLNPPTP